VSRADAFMLDPAEEVARKLDQVVGKRYQPAARQHGLRRAGSTLARWLAGALCAVAAVATIVWMIESHRLPKEIPQRASKPVAVTIVPAPGKAP
jgi:hypothetical protein